MISEKEINALATVHSDLCWSAYLPTHAQGHESWSGNDKIQFKNQLQTLRRDLAAKQLNPSELEEFCQPLQELLDDPTFWQHQASALAVFRSQDIFQYVKLPVEVPLQYYLSTEFLVWPLIALSSKVNSAYVLSLHQDSLKLYLADPYEIEEITGEALSKLNLESAVGSDVVQKNLQFRTYQGARQSAAFHGHGEGKEDKNIEIQKFLRVVDGTVMDSIKDRDKKLILVGPRRLLSIYREISKAEILHDKIIVEGRELSQQKIFAEVKNILEADQEQHRQNLWSDFLDVQDTAHSGTGIDDVLPEAMVGKIETLFISGYPKIFGTFDPASGKVQILPESDPASVSLVNRAAVLTAQNRGKIVQISAPDGSINEDLFAIYRYA